MTRQQVQQAFNDSVGVILTYLDEAEVGLSTKRAVKAEMWELCDRKIMPMVEELEQEGETNDGRFNR